MRLGFVDRFEGACRPASAWGDWGGGGTATVEILVLAASMTFEGPTSITISSVGITKY